ncbi:MAG TPA: hypothetical protein VMA73_28500, partial [Streptosporangiaceae bacterium]|nr:hypothetical protein [Streptosporangiaceae bacterium]
PTSPARALTAFEHGWTVIALIGFAAAVIGATVLRRLSPAPAGAPAPAGGPPQASARRPVQVSEVD